MQSYMPYLKTLRRIPKDVILRMATREFHMGSHRLCVCGWALRETLANGLPAEKITPRDPRWGWRHVPNLLQQEYGGTPKEWGDIFWGVTRASDFPDIETAFAIRVAECAK